MKVIRTTATVQRDSTKILDEYLIAAAVTGDRGAWARLVVRWQPKLLRHAWRVLADAERAKDVVQEAWVEILRGLRRLDDYAAFPAWAFRIVTRRCQRLFRGNQRDWRMAEDLAPDTDSAALEIDHAESLADLPQVLAAVQALPAPQRAALALFYLEDLSVAEIAIALDVAPGTVKTRLMHARRKVRAQLEGAGNEQVR